MSFSIEAITLQGDCREILADLPDDSVDAIVTDPPYGLSFMGRDWDKALPPPDAWEQALRVAKPGAHLVAFGAPRLYHRLGCQIEDAGWEVRDCLMWLYGSGFPKSLNVSKAIGDPEAWDGWGTALKPAWEPIILARKPLDGTVAANVLEHSTGALNIDGCRIGTSGATTSTREGHDTVSTFGSGLNGGGKIDVPKGRWPANLVLDETAAAMLDAEVGERKPGGRISEGVVRGTHSNGVYSPAKGTTGAWAGYGDSGGPSRFFYCAKASKTEREAGLDHLPLAYVDPSRAEGSAGRQSPRAGAGRNTQRRNRHPTVKPIALMRWLIRLVTPPGGLVVDPFMGSGSTGCAAVLEGFNFAGVDLDPEHVRVAEARIQHWRNA